MLVQTIQVPQNERLSITMPASTNLSPDFPQVFDIGGSKISDQVQKQLREKLPAAKANGERICLPDELLYDDVGLGLWAKMIYHEEYYQTLDEINILEINGMEIASYIPSCASLIDLGSGDLQKVEHLLKQLEMRGDSSEYLAIDISRKSLEANLNYLFPLHKTVRCLGWWGTFADAMGKCQDEPVASPRVFLSLGSVLCNDAWGTAISHLRAWSDIMRPQDLLLIGMDGHARLEEHKDKIWRAYHPNNDYYQRFFRNGFQHANRLLEEEWFRLEDWDIVGSVEQQGPAVCHRFILEAKKDVELGSSGVRFRKGEQMDWFDAHKYGPEDVKKMCKIASLEVLKAWKAPRSQMYHYLVRRGGPVNGKMPSVHNGVHNGMNGLCG